MKGVTERKPDLRLGNGKVNGEVARASIAANRLRAVEYRARSRAIASRKASFRPCYVVTARKSDAVERGRGGEAYPVHRDEKTPHAHPPVAAEPPR